MNQLVEQHQNQRAASLLPRRLTTRCRLHKRRKNRAVMPMKMSKSARVSLFPILHSKPHILQTLTNVNLFKAPICGEGEFQCDSKCFSSSKRCDSVNDCKDGSDEKECSGNIMQTNAVSSISVYFSLQQNNRNTDRLYFEIEKHDLIS